MAPPAKTSPPKNGMATAGMICGIIGIVLCWFPFLGLIAAVLGIVFGSIGMSRANRLYGAGRGAAIAGLVCGILSFLLLPIMAAIAIPAFLEYMHKSKTSESAIHLREIEHRIKSYYLERAELPPSAGEMPGPPKAACNNQLGNGQYKHPVRSYADWQQDPGWKALDFQLANVSAFSYLWTRQSPTHGYIEANADRDCDSTISTTRWDVEVIDGNVQVLQSPPTPE